MAVILTITVTTILNDGAKMTSTMALPKPPLSAHPLLYHLQITLILPCPTLVSGNCEPAISHFSPVMGLFRKQVQEATHGRLNFTTTKKCHSLTIRNVSDITSPSTLFLSTWESKRVINDCTHPPGFCVAVDPQTTNCHRTIVTPPPHHGIAPYQ